MGCKTEVVTVGVGMKRSEWIQDITRGRTNSFASRLDVGKEEREPPKARPRFPV